MDAAFVKSCLESAADGRHAFTLLLRGAHTLEVRSASVRLLDGDSDESRFEIRGTVSADGRPAAQSTVYVSSGDIAALQVTPE